MRFTTAALLASALLMISATTARADEFTITGNGSTYTFELPASPVVVDYSTGQYFQSYINITSGSTTYDDDLTYFFTPAEGGGLEDNDLYFGLNLYGAQLYSGTESDPTFIPGTYVTSQNDDGQNDYTIVISADTPEPSSLVLLGTGLAGALAAARRRLKA